MCIEFLFGIIHGKFLGGFSINVMNASVMLCVCVEFPLRHKQQVYLKLPAYTSRAALEAKLKHAITEGQDHFALD